MLPDKDVRITVYSSKNKREYRVTVTHWPTKVSLQLQASKAQPEGPVISKALHELEKRIALFHHRRSRNKNWP